MWSAWVAQQPNDAESSPMVQKAKLSQPYWPGLGEGLMVAYEIIISAASKHIFVLSGSWALPTKQERGWREDISNLYRWLSKSLMADINLSMGLPESGVCGHCQQSCLYYGLF